MHPHLNEVYPYPRTRQPQLREAYSDAGGYVYTGGGVLRVWELEPAQKHNCQLMFSFCKNFG